MGTTTKEIISQANSKMKSMIEELLLDVLVDISTTYKINLDELCSKYMTDSNSNGVNNEQVVEEPDPKTPTKKKAATKAMSEVPPAPKKRGRKKKDKDEFVKTEEYEFEGTVYLVDEKNNVYSNDVENLKFVGEKLVDGSIKLH